MPAYWPLIVAQRKGNHGELSHLLRVMSFSESFKVIHAFLGFLAETLWSQCLVIENSLNHVSNQTKKKEFEFATQKNYSDSQKMISKRNALLELTLKYPHALGKQVRHLCWVTVPTRHFTSPQHFFILFYPASVSDQAHLNVMSNFHFRLITASQGVNSLK